MSRIKPIVILALATLIGTAGCSEIAGPDAGVCPVTGGPGVCASVTQTR